MAVRHIRLPIFTDNDVPDSVGAVFMAAGHAVTRLRDCMANNTADQVVEAACRAGGLVLVTHNYKDFRRIARDQAGLTKRQTHELCRIELLCRQPNSARRVREEMEFIAMGWERFLADQSAAMCVTIGENFVKLARGPELTRERAVAPPLGLTA